MADVGRYRWCVLAAACTAHGLLAMLIETGGAYHVIFLNAFQGGSGDTALVSSLNTAMFFAVGPLAGVLVGTFRCWQVALVGGLLGGLGVTVSAFANGLPMLYFTFGVVAGVGMGIAYMPAITSVSHVFNKNRTLAFGIASSGAGVGKFLAPLLLNATEQHFGWRGALVIVGALVLNLCLCAFVYYRPSDRILDVIKEQQELRQVLNETPGIESGQGITQETDVLPDDTRDGQSSMVGSSLGRQIALRQQDRSCAGSDLSLALAMASRLDLKMPLPDNDQDNTVVPMPLIAQKELLENIKNELALEGSLGGLTAAMSTSSLYLSAAAELGEHYYGSSGRLYNSHLYLGRKSNQVSAMDLNWPVSQDLKVSNSIITSPIVLSNGGSKLSSCLSLPMKPRLESVCEQEPLPKSTHRKIIARLNLFLLADPEFFTLAINNLLFSMGYAVANVHLPAFAILKGVDPSSATLLMSAFGIASIVGKLILGLISQHPRLSPISVYTVTFALAAAATFLVPFGSSMVYFVTYALFYGFIAGSFGSVLPALIVAMTALELLPSAYGYLLLFEAVGFLFGPSIAGWLYDATGLYSSSFYFGGSVMLLAALIMLYPWYKSICRNKDSAISDTPDEDPKA